MLITFLLVFSHFPITSHVCLLKLNTYMYTNIALFKLFQNLFHHGPYHITATTPPPFPPFLQHTPYFFLSAILSCCLSKSFICLLFWALICVFQYCLFLFRPPLMSSYFLFLIVPSFISFELTFICRISFYFESPNSRYVILLTVD